jgi:hypothetical protein
MFDRHNKLSWFATIENRIVGSRRRLQRREDRDWLALNDASFADWLNLRSRPGERCRSPQAASFGEPEIEEATVVGKELDALATKHAPQGRRKQSNFAAGGDAGRHIEEAFKIVRRTGDLFVVAFDQAASRGPAAILHDRLSWAGARSDDAQRSPWARSRGLRFDQSRWLRLAA